MISRLLIAKLLPEKGAPWWHFLPPPPQASGPSAEGTGCPTLASAQVSPSERGHAVTGWPGGWLRGHFLQNLQRRAVCKVALAAWARPAKNKATRGADGRTRWAKRDAGATSGAITTATCAISQLPSTPARSPAACSVVTDGRPPDLTRGRRRGPPFRPLLAGTGPALFWVYRQRPP